MLYFLSQLRKVNLPQELLKQFYSAIIESLLCSSITIWFCSATKTDIRRLQRTVRSAERIIGARQLNLQDLYVCRVRKRAKKVTLDPSHPAHSLFERLHFFNNYNWIFPPWSYPTWTTHNTPQYCTSVNNSSNLHLYIGRIHSSVYGHFYFLYIFFTVVIYISSLLVFLLP